jgi:hypothetical protein
MFLARSAEIPVRNNILLASTAANRGRTAEWNLLRTGMSALR